MGLAFETSLQHLFDKVSEPLHDFFAGDFFTAHAPKVDQHHEMLWDCYLSGQMMDADLDAEIKADPVFGAFVMVRQAQRH